MIDQPQLGHDALLGDGLGLVHHVGAEPEGVAGEELGDLALLAALAQPDVVHEGAVAAARVHDEELALVEHEHGVVPGQHLAVKEAIARVGFVFFVRSTDSDWAREL